MPTNPSIGLVRTVPVRSTPPSSTASSSPCTGLIGSMGRRGNPHDNANAENFMDAQGRGGYQMAYEKP
jgi:hypothetical protein